MEALLSLRKPFLGPYGNCTDVLGLAGGCYIFSITLSYIVAA